MTPANRRSGDAARLAPAVARLLGARRARLVPVAGNWGLTVYRAETDQGLAAVKAGTPVLEGHLETEARMLADLARAGLKVPTVLALGENMLATEWIEHERTELRPIHERAAAEALLSLHAAARPAFGYPYPTQIGALRQPNEEGVTWTGFFRDRRLCHYAACAARAGLIDAGLLGRIERLAARLDRFLDEPDHPSLLHGDIWTGNVLIHGRRLGAFVDPALFCGHREYELAHVTLHGTFGHAFFAAYAASWPVPREFTELRRDIYLIVPLLQHAILSGPAYLHRIDRTLGRLGI